MSQEIQNQVAIQQSQSDKKQARLLTGAGATGAIIAVSASRPAGAQTAVQDVNTMVTSLGSIATAATGVILGAMVVRLAIKFVNRLTVKG